MALTSIQTFLLRLRKRYSITGVWFAYLFFWASLTPSLMPRSWILQGVLSGVVIVAGYLLGRLISAVARKLVSRQLPQSWGLAAWIVIGIGGMLLSIGQLYLRIEWQREAYTLMQMEHPRDNFITSSVCILALALMIAYALKIILRFFYRASRRAYRYLLGRKWLTRMPPFLSRLAALLLIGVVVLTLVTDQLPSYMLSIADRISRSYNDTFSDEFVQPESPLLSGSSASLVTWESLGANGREFVSSGPTAEHIADFNMVDSALDPIRVYVGTDFSNNLSAQARIAVRELERVNAFEREAVLVVITTGSGLVDLQSTRPLEYMFNGDIATVAIQYSYLPSWLSFLSDQERAQEAALELISQVTAAIEEIPEGNRPKLYLFAESLGSFGAEASFESLEALLAANDGTLLIGTPGFNPITREIIANRDPGSPQYLPVYDQDNRIVNSTGTDWSLDELIAKKPQLIYLRNPSDPVVKWNWELFWKEPQWVSEQKRDGLLPDRFHWYPALTFFQLSADMLIANQVPPGYGHNYGTHAIYAWAALTGLEGWTEGEVKRLQRELERW
ncbi:alpha/beta hydrolase [Paenibacillus senegalensis]|uniref:alpha/beta hydrolase n=1 Tax=Paenibacillus senegalensis TaxID=1465766 RepID=UPI000287A3F2|nr:alpha/beta-hydrolase family protein [Paenibacillus senegalensis]